MVIIEVYMDMIKEEVFLKFTFNALNFYKNEKIYKTMILLIYIIL